MPVQERDYMKAPGPEAAPRASAWMARLNDFGERHARIIISVSTALVILVVLVFAKHFYDRSMMERAERDLAQADTVERLQEFKAKYASYPAAARFVYRLANKYYSEGQLEAARDEYLDFQIRFPGHPYLPYVQHSLDSVKRNLAFEKDQKELLRKEHALRTHSTTMAGAQDPRLQWGPAREPNPVVEIETPRGPVKVELYEYEVPNAVANFVKLCEEKYFDGVKLDLVNGDERLKTQPRAEKPADYALAAEKSDRTAEEGSLVLVPKEGTSECPGGEFQMLLKAPAGLKDAVIFGFVKDGLPALKSLKKDDEIKSTKVVTKRDHKYEPQVLKKP